MLMKPLKLVLSPNSAICHPLAEDHQEGIRVSMDNKSVRVPLDWFMERYIVGSDEPPDRLLSKFNFQGVVKSEAQMCKKIVRRLCHVYPHLLMRSL